MLLLAQTNPCKDSVIILSCKDIVSVRPPELHTDLVVLRQFDDAAHTCHLATLIRQSGVIQRHHLLPIFVYTTLSTPIHRHMHSEVIEAIHGAGEDTCVRTVASSLVDQHGGKLQDSTVFWVAVTDIQLGCESYSAC